MTGYEPLSRDELLGLLAGRHARIARLEAENAELRRAVEELREQVARLTRIVSRNSGDSSMPPSADDLPGRTPPPPQPQIQRGGRGKRKPGKQPGAPRRHLAWSEEPDARVDHFPAGACACGAAIEDGRDLGVAASHQEIDVPLATARVIQHDRHEVACACGRVHRAPAPAGAGMPGTVTYSLSVQALCVYLLAVHAIPVHRCAELIGALTGAVPSDVGSIRADQFWRGGDYRDRRSGRHNTVRASTGVCHHCSEGGGGWESNDTRSSTGIVRRDILAQAVRPANEV